MGKVRSSNEGRRMHVRSSGDTMPDVLRNVAPAATRCVCGDVGRFCGHEAYYPTQVQTKVLNARLNRDAIQQFREYCINVPTRGQDGPRSLSASQAYNQHHQSACGGRSLTFGVDLSTYSRTRF
jgi:hypothetical protein